MTQEDHRLTKTEREPGVHPTARRAFLTGLGLSVVSLYGVWAAYGAAPTSLSFLATGGDGGHGGGHGAGGGMDPEEFRRLTERFIAANELPDGSVKPRRNWMTTAEASDDHEASAHGDDDSAHGDEDSAHGHDEPHEAAPAPSPEHDEPHDAHEPAVAMDEHDAGADGDAPIDVYLMASRYGYTPATLRLDRDVRYRFRIMAVDANHGASMNMRMGSHMVRCPAGTLLEKSIAFTKPGQLLVYCSVYCGEGHDMMWSRFIIT